MALASSGRSTLNPDAPLFIPAAVRQVEDFSPEWWDLVTNSAWFQDYWLSQRQGEDGFSGNTADEYRSSVADLLPDSIDLGIDEDFSNMEVQFEEFIQSGWAGEDPLTSLKSLKERNLSKILEEENAKPPAPAKSIGRSRQRV